MIFLTPLALAGLVLLPAVVFLYLWRPRARIVVTPSLLFWAGLERPGRVRSRTWQLPLLALLLQLLVITVLVFSLARPAGEAHRAVPASRLVILDDSMAMTIEVQGHSQLALARQALARQVDSSPSQRITLILATSRPRVLLLHAPAHRVLSAVASLTPEMAAPDFADAYRLATGLAPNRTVPITVVRAVQDTLPRLVGYRLRSVAVGDSTDNQVLRRFTVGCTDGGTVCAGLAVAVNYAPFAVHDRLAVLGDGDPMAERTVALGAHASAEISFPVPAGHKVVEIQLQRRDILPADNTAWSLVPASRLTRITVVGKGAAARVLARVARSIPHAMVQVVTPSQFDPSRAPWSDLLILDHWTGRGVPAAGAVLFVNPAYFGGHITVPLADTTLTGEDASSPLLAGVDLTSLDVPAGDARQMQLPAGVTPLVWSAGGPLLAAGTMQGEHVAVLAFNLLQSDLPQLSAYPAFVANLATWARSWLPASAPVGSVVALERVPGTKLITISSTGYRRTLAPGTTFIPSAPGLYRVVERGRWGSRVGELAASVGYPSLSPVVTVRQGHATSVSIATYVTWWPWIGIVAVLAILAEVFLTSFAGYHL